jgi:hypothetical protein
MFMGAVACAQEAHEHPAPAEEAHAGHVIPVTSLFPLREASGTAWLPDMTPMHGVHLRPGPWEVMLHGNVFAQFLYESGEDHRQSQQAGSINWFMAMARRPWAGGRIGLRGMASLEPFTIPGCGYPVLLATGETCHGDTIHDRQHPHDLFMELAVEYDRPLTSSLRWQVYGGPAGEPALGPVAFPHRPSAMPNPVALIGHHWLDATHISFGVLTGGVYGEGWKAEASVFNGREPDENRVDLDLAALDSVSGRLSLAPTPNLALQVSAGHLARAEAQHAGGPVHDVLRVTASATYHRRVRERGLWATTVAWGANEEPTESSHAVVLESAASPDGYNSWFARLEVSGKPAHDLHIHESRRVFTVGKLQGGYVRSLSARHGVQPGFGGTLSASVLPAGLQARYGGAVAPGFGVFLTVRPAAH